MTMKFGWMIDGEAGPRTGLPGGRAALVAAAALLTTAIASVATHAQAPAGSVWTGAFTTEQAVRGKAAYADNCAACHGPTLTGGDSAPPLAGSNFLNNWNNTSTADLFARIHDTMPAQDPGSLSGRTVSDIEAFILQTNGFPAGTTALATDPQLMGNTRILGTKPGQ
ncbi:c-type cytochrome [Sphingomonas sp. QA11]|uniref:c-type cytochrome n=1 Tax=Sphingomonas sp. QA11 TaxID=2950605 RepID=UPI002349E411|nr:cytochrome c [Sphingomonas sp. QA11]WCM26647.1 c-type cytochrome [Sphingomonas sp. QA11]